MGDEDFEARLALEQNRRPIRVPVLIVLGGAGLTTAGFVSGVPGIDATIGVVAVLVGMGMLGARIGPRPAILGSILLSLLGGTGGWLFEVFIHDGAEVNATVSSFNDTPLAGITGEGTSYFGEVRSFEEDTTSISCRVEAFDEAGEVVGTDKFTIRVPANGEVSIDRNLDVPGLVPGGSIRVREEIGGVCTAHAAT